jgi:inosose dehydratase
MSVRIGINPLTWTNDDMPELGGDTPLEVCLREAKEAGYAGMELGNKFPRQSKALQAALAPYGLACVSGWYSARLLERSVSAELEAVRPHLDLLAACGSNVMVFAETSRCVHGDKTVPLSKRPVLQDSEWKRFGEALTKVAEGLAKSGVRLAYHHHMGTVVQSEGDIDALMRHTGESVGLLLDTGHLTYAGGDVVRVARAYKQRIRHVHMKDVRPKVLERARAADWPFLAAVLEGVFTVPGDGCIDYPAVLRVLAEGRYDGWLVVEAEQDPKKAHPLTYAKMGFAYAKEQARAAGLLK